MIKNNLFCLLFSISSLTVCGKNVYDRNDSIYLAIDSLYRFYNPEWVDELDTDKIPLRRRIIFQDLCSKKMNDTNLMNTDSRFEAYYVSHRYQSDGSDFVLLKINNVFKLYNWETGKIGVLKIVYRIMNEDKSILSEDRWNNLIHNLITFRSRGDYPMQEKIYNLQIYFPKIR